MKSWKKTSLSMLALILVFVFALAACNNNNGGSNEAAPNGTNEGTTNEAGDEGNATMAADQIFRMNLHSEPPTLDPGMTQDNISGTVLNAILEGLTRVDKDGQVIPGMAEKWEISEDNKTYTFTLRDAQWSNGDPVKASDFEYAWKRALDPNKETPSPYAYQLYYLENAEAYNAGEITDAAEVGVTAQDDKTLVVKLTQPTPYFLNLLTFYTYFPINQANAEANANFDKEAATMVSNGPFTLAEWNHNESIILNKSDSYYAKDEIKLNEVHMSMINDPNTEISLYDTDELDWAGRPAGEIPTDLLPSLKADPEKNLQIKGIASTYYYNFNTTKAPFDNVKVRKAFAMAINRQAIIDAVTLGEQIPAYGFVPAGIKGDKDEFRKEVKDSYFTEDLEEAKKLLAEGLSEAGLDAVPTVELIHNEGEGHRVIAEAIADMWKKNLGVEVTVQAQEWGVFLTNRTNLNYQIARAGWGADYNDPMTFLDMWTSTSGNNDVGFKNPDYDKLIADARAETDPAKRVEIMAEAEKMMIDNMIVMPIYYYTGIWMQKEHVKDVFIDYAGEINFTRGYIAEH